MAGLDSIKHYNGEEGSSVSSDEPVAPLSAKAPTTKSPYALAKPTSVTGVDPALLENMQQLINEREAKKNSLSESMRDATAWWSGGVAGPGEALRARAKDREEQEATTFGMKRELAQSKIAQQQAQNMQRDLFGGTSAPQTGQQMAPGAPAGAPTVPQGGLIGLVKNDSLRQSIAAQAQTDQAGAFKAIQSYLAKNAEDPVMVKELKYMIDNKLIDPNLIPAAVLTKFVGAGAFDPKDVRTPGGTGQTIPLNTAASMSPKGAPAPRTPAALAPPAAPMAPPAAPMAPAAAPMAPAAAAPAAPLSLPAVPAAVPPLASRAPGAPPVPGAARPPMAPPAAPMAPPEAAPLLSPKLQTGFNPGSKEDLEAKAAAAKSKIELGAEQQKPIEKSAGESAVSLTNLASNAKNNITEYDMAENILKKYPKAFGIAQDGSATAAVIQLIKPGTTIPILGTIKSEGIEEAVAQRGLPKKAIEARNIFNAIATRQGVEYAKNNLTGEGRGTLSNADMKMAQVAKGLSTDSPAAANLIFTVLNRENETMTLQRAESWKNYQANARSQGVQADFNRFKETPEYTKSLEEKDARVRKRFPEFFKNEAAAPTSGRKVYNPKTGKAE
jgi:hypothetical protein